ncbi:S49 family peptidase [Rickettsiales bacterium]|nr:S49 family peptidase [Rickettsiales bacterium]MDB2550293.1 S49 family peptidase [Rickettsiales bacterium]
MPKKEKSCPMSILCKLTKKILSKKDSQIAVINLNGVIGNVSKFDKGINIDNVNPLLEKAFKEKKFKAVAINVNSPGGSPVQSELIFQRITELSKEKKMPVFTFARDVAASGGYFILCAGDEIYAHDSSIIGSIGVISASFGFEKAIKKIGVERRIYTEGKNKAVMDPFSPEDPDNIKILKAVQKDIFANFKNIVKTARGKKLKKTDATLFNGAFWSGTESKKIGLIDDIANMRDIMKKKYGKKVKLVEIKEKKKGFVKDLLSTKFDDFSENIIENIFNKIEERSSWNKFK